MKSNDTNIKFVPYVEDAEPKRDVLKSDILFYLFVLFTAVLLIFSVSYLFFIAKADGIIPQLVLFALLLGYGWLIYKKQLVRYRYTVGESILKVERVVGKKVRTEITVHLSDITRVSPYDRAALKDIKHRDAFFCGKRSSTAVVFYRLNRETRTVLLSLSEEGKNRVRAAMKAAHK